MELTLNGNAIPAIETVWVMVAAILVMFMQVGFLFLEVGFSRMKNAGTIVPKILANFSIAALCYWAVGFALAFGGTRLVRRHRGHLPRHEQRRPVPGDGVLEAAVPAKFFFQFVFCAVSLAIVWGTTIERIKFGAYLIYAVVFSSLIYPIISHWIFGGGWLQANFGMQDFAGSTVVHLIGATGALAALLLLGPRQGKYGKDGSPNVIPGHNMPLVGLAVLVLWFGWFGFNAGLHPRRGRTALRRRGRGDQPGGGRRRARRAARQPAAREDVRHRHGRQRRDRRPGGHHGALGLRRVLGGADHRRVAGVIVVFCIIAIDKRPRRPRRRAVGARCGRHLGHARRAGCSPPRGWLSYNEIGEGGLFYTGSFEQLGVQALGVAAAFTTVFVVSFLVFSAIKRTYGLRVGPEEERRGLDIVEHGMWGYPEQFMPVPGSEYHPPNTPGAADSRPASRPGPRRAR